MRTRLRLAHIAAYVAFLLPGCFMHDHDKKWVDEQLLLIPDPMRAKILSKYEFLYACVIAQNEGKIEAEGLARREANTRLRECVAKFGSAYNGTTISPPTVGKC